MKDFSASGMFSDILIIITIYFQLSSFALAPLPGLSGGPEPALTVYWIKQRQVGPETEAARIYAQHNLSKQNAAKVMWWHGTAGLEGRQAAPVTRLQSIQNIKLDILKAKKKKILLAHNQLTILEFSHVHFTPEKLSWSQKTSNRHHLNSQACNSMRTLLSPMTVRLKQGGWRAKTIRIII